MQQSHLRDFLECMLRHKALPNGISPTVGFQRNKMKSWELLNADDFNLQSIGSRYRQVSVKTQTSLLIVYVGEQGRRLTCLRYISDPWTVDEVNNKKIFTKDFLLTHNIFDSVTRAHSDIPVVNIECFVLVRTVGIL